eukprot:tig00000076_g2437.t1
MASERTLTEAEAEPEIVPKAPAPAPAARKAKKKHAAPQAPPAKSVYVCRYFAQGFCRLGHHCRFLHPVSTGAAPVSDSAEGECAICSEPLIAPSTRGPARRLYCGHEFHGACVDGWARSDFSDGCCPICRAPLDRDGSQLQLATQVGPAAAAVSQTALSSSAPPPWGGAPPPASGRAADDVDVASMQRRLAEMRAELAAAAEREARLAAELAEVQRRGAASRGQRANSNTRPPAYGRREV